MWGELDEGLASVEEEGVARAPEGPLEVWRRWADRVEGSAIASGHFIPEEAPDELVDALAPFLSGMAG